MLETFRKIFEFAGGNRSLLKKSIVFSIINSIFDTFEIIALAIVMGGLIKGIQPKIVWQSLVVMLISVIGKIVTGYISDFGQTKVGYFMCAEKRIHIGDRLKYMPMGYFNNHSLGNITAAVTTTMSDIEHNAPTVLREVLHGFILSVAMAIGITIFDWRIGFIVFAGILLFIWMNALLQKKSQVDSPKKQLAQEKLVEDTLEYIHGMSVVKSFNLDNNSNKKIDKAIEEARDKNLKIEKVFIPYITMQQLLLNIISVVIILTSILFYLNGTMELNNCLLMVVSAFLIYTQLESAGSMASLLRILDISIDKVNEIDKAPVVDINGKDIKPKNFNIEVKDVDFSYEERKILSHINLKIPQNTTTAIVGKSGSGKSTLCSLITRFWDVDGGSVTLGGRDVREYKMDSLLKNFSMVFQNVYLFEDTIANNIKFGNPEAPMEEVIEAAKKACCHDFIMELPDGYDTVIGEGGNTISGGQKQRISIARAILKDAPIIILDEATSNVDPENESQLQSAIQALTRNKTIIMIAHRLKTVRNADQIIVVNGGEIVQCGTHDELIKQPGIYADFIGVRKKAVGWKIVK